MSDEWIARFFSKVNKDGPIPEHCPELGPCWVWTGALSGGYGSTWAEIGETLAHRISYEIVNGSIPDGIQVCHHCDNPPCVNPDHLFLGTTDDNMKDMSAKGRAARGERNYSAKLTEGDVREIRRREAAGESRQVLAAVYGVGITTIFEIVHRTKWKHVE